MTDTSEIARIAAGLSEAARKAFVRGGVGHVSLGEELVSHGLATFMPARLIKLTPLGISVRAYLEKQG